MKRQLKLAVLSLFLCVTSAFAVPAMRGVKKMITLPDGTKVMAELKGDENMNYYSTEDGRALRKLNGAYRFVNLDSIRNVGAERFKERNEARMARARKASGTFSGKKKGLVILVNTMDKKFTTSASEWNDYFNKVGYNGSGMGGSVHDYFLEQSYGQFDLEFDVVGPIEAGHNSTYYASNDDYYVPDLIKEACKAIDDQVDFRDYDWDGDGYVDQVYMVYAGYGAAQGADGTIWPHEWKLSASHLGGSYPTADGVNVNTYACSCELHGDGKLEAGKIDGIGTACHEFSHCLGLPDFYDTGSAGCWGMDVWSLLDYGCYNGGYGYVPCGYTSYERWFAGWLEPVELTEATRISDMPCLQNNPTAYIVYNQADRNEFYMFENRQLQGFDREMYGHGMLVLHVDYNANAWKSNTVNNVSNHQRMTVVVADGRYGGAGQNASGDPFPGSSNVTELTNTSSPAATLYNENSDGKKFLNAPVTKIDETNGLITFDIFGGVDLGAPIANEATNVSAEKACFTANWEPVEGAKSYTLKVVSSIETSPWAYTIFAEDFEGCNFEIAGTSKDVGSMLDKYTTNPGFTGKNVYRSPHKLRVGKVTEEGWVTTPAIDAPKSGTITYLVGVLGVSATTDIDMYVETASGTNGTARIGSVPSYASAPEGQYAYYCFTQEPWTYGDYFRLTFSPTSTGNFYLGFVGAFDGAFVWDDFSDSEFGVKGERDFAHIGLTESTFPCQTSTIEWFGKDGKRAAAPRKKKEETELDIFSTTETSKAINVTKPGTYVYKVRAVTDKGNTDWSEEIVVDMTDVDAIGTVAADRNADGAVFDLQGRRVSKPAHGIYIRNGKKFLVK